MNHHKFQNRDRRAYSTIFSSEIEAPLKRSIPVDRRRKSISTLTTIIRDSAISMHWEDMGYHDDDDNDDDDDDDDNDNYVDNDDEDTDNTENDLRLTKKTPAPPQLITGGKRPTKITSSSNHNRHSWVLSSSTQKMWESVKRPIENCHVVNQHQRSSYSFQSNISSSAFVKIVKAGTAIKQFMGVGNQRKRNTEAHHQTGQTNPFE
ncbi:hypothetical protein G9A89_006740 [Geosiphon pyriformis]|nr:hypothetical protein G9A89_006740 [Geosiphon pyriformis]